MEQFGGQFLSHFPAQSRAEEPLGHLYSRDTTIQGTQDFVPEKSSYNLPICYLFWMDTSIQGKGTFFLGPETSGFNLHSWITLAIKRASKVTDRKNRLYKFKGSLVTMVTAFKTWINSLKSMHCICGNSTHNIAEIRRDKLIMVFFIYFLAAWNDDCSRFRSLWKRMPLSALIIIFYLLVNYWQTSAQPPFKSDTSFQGTCALFPRVSPEYRFHSA